MMGEITEREFSILARVLQRREEVKKDKEAKAAQGLSTLPSLNQVVKTLKHGEQLRKDGFGVVHSTLPPGIKALVDSQDDSLKRRRQKYKLPPVIQNQKAIHLSESQKAGAGLKVRDFYTVTVRGNNPNESHFHMQARIGFQRRKAGNVRLRPVESHNYSELKAQAKEKRYRRRMEAVDAIPIKVPEDEILEVAEPQDSKVARPPSACTTVCPEEPNPMRKVLEEEPSPPPSSRVETLAAMDSPRSVHDDTSTGELSPRDCVKLAIQEALRGAALRLEGSKGEETKQVKEDEVTDAAAAPQASPVEDLS